MLKVRSKKFGQKTNLCKICGCRIEEKYEYCGKHFQDSHKIIQPAGKIRFFAKSKKERQKWWENLTLEQQIEYLEKVQKRKAAKRRSKSIKMMERLNLNYNCNLCIHGITNSCTDNLPRGCEYFAEAEKLFLQKIP